MNASGSLLLSSSRDNSNRVWDIRSAKPLVRLKGHQNTSKNFIKSSFGPSQQLIVGGSEDGCIYLWDVNNGNLVQKLRAHHGIVYNVRWHPVAELLLSCSHDRSVKTWWYDSSQETDSSFSGVGIYWHWLLHHAILMTFQFLPFDVYVVLNFDFAGSILP